MELGRVFAQDHLRALAHLASGLVREGHGEDAPRGNAPFAHEPGDAMGDHARLAATGPREDELRALGVLRCRELSRIERVDGGGKGFGGRHGSILP